MDATFASAALLLKVVIPSENTTKTIRIETKIKVGELQERIKKKIFTKACQGDEDFGLFWYSDKGPLWLSDGSTLKSYNMKNGDTLEYKKRPPKITREGTVQPTATYLSSVSVGEMSPRMQQDKLDKQPVSPAMRQTIAAIKTNNTASKGSALWVPVRPGSAHGLSPVNPTKALSTSPATSSATSSPRMPPAPTPEFESLDSLDSLIDGFDEQLLDGEPTDLFSSSEIKGNPTPPDDAPDNCENDDNGSLSFNTMSKNYYDSQPVALSASEQSTASNSDDSKSYTMPSASMDIYNRAQQQRMIEDKVSLTVVERILSDALKGIEAGDIDMELVKMYISSAVTIIRNMS